MQNANRQTNKQTKYRRKIAKTQTKKTEKNQSNKITN